MTVLGGEHSFSETLMQHMTQNNSALLDLHHARCGCMNVTTVVVCNTIPMRDDMPARFEGHVLACSACPKHMPMLAVQQKAVGEPFPAAHDPGTGPRCQSSKHRCQVSTDALPILHAGMFKLFS
jgi:hypothetical protein